MCEEEKQMRDEYNKEKYSTNEPHASDCNIWVDEKCNCFQRLYED